MLVMQDMTVILAQQLDLNPKVLRNSCLYPSFSNCNWPLSNTRDSTSMLMAGLRVSDLRVTLIPSCLHTHRGLLLFDGKNAFVLHIEALDIRRSL